MKHQYDLDCVCFQPTTNHLLMWTGAVVCFALLWSMYLHCMCSARGLFLCVTHKKASESAVLHLEGHIFSAI